MDQDNSDFSRNFKNLNLSSSRPPEASGVDSSPPTPKESGENNSERERSRDIPDSDAKVTLRLKTVAGASAVLLVVFAVFSTPSGRTRGTGDVRSSQMENVRQIRTVEEARAEQGFFRRMLCNGSWKARICQ
ncbi:MAG: hypothetical protein U0136_01825 [Bdellovibrionota bacterium]